MLPQSLDLGATAYLPPDKARQEYSEEEEKGEGAKKTKQKKQGKTKQRREIIRVLLKCGGRNKDAGERSEPEQPPSFGLIL